MVTTSPTPFPENGQRKLSPKETMQRARALACTMPKDKKPACSGQVFAGIFFDGTGNNRKIDYEDPAPDKRKHTNIVRIFHTFPLPEIKPGHFRIYIPGVGTAFPEIDDPGKSWEATAGSASAWKGEHRIAWALIQLLNAPHRYVYNNAPLIQPDQAKTIIGNVAGVTSPGMMRRLVLNTWQQKLAVALKDKKPKVEQINLSVFGFSRGAAEARAFVNWLFEICKPEGDGWKLAGIPLRLQFLGLFDTVASVGAANLYDGGTLAGHQSWADNSQEIHPAVERCVHFVAGHEVRACFPLDSVRVKLNYPGNALEVMYPGVHSDVGGGYAPGDLGVSLTPDSMLATIPGFNMYKEAVKSGVPLLVWKDLGKQFQDDLTPSDDAISDFNAYLHAAKVEAASVEEMGKKHMAYYFSYRFKYRADFQQRAPYVNATEEHQAYLKRTQDCLLERLGSLHQRSSPLANYSPTPMAESAPRVHVAPADPGRKKREVAMAPDFDPPTAAASAAERMAANKPAPVIVAPIATTHAIEVGKRIDTKILTPEIERFFDHYLHDSMAGFIGMGMDEYRRNDIGFVKFRTVFKGND